MVLEGLKFHLTLQEIANTVHARDRGSVAVQIYYSDPNLSWAAWNVTWTFFQVPEEKIFDPMKMERAEVQRDAIWIPKL